MKGWGTLRFTASFFLFYFVSASAFGSQIQCSESVSGLDAFENAWTRDFSRYPDIAQTSAHLRQSLLTQDNLQSDVRAYLQTGGDPLTMGNAGLVESLGNAYLRIIEASHVSDEHKVKLRDSLALAVADLASLSAQSPVHYLFSGGPGDGKGDGTGDGGVPPGGPSNRPLTDAERKILTPDVFMYLKSAGLRRCITRTTILFVVSNILNTVGALEAKWAQYAGPDAQIRAILQADTWNQAWKDSEFRHNVVWNALLMIALGGFSCMSSQKMGKNLMAAVALGASVGGQLVTTGKVSVKQTVHDTLFVRFISINKSQFVFRMAESYGRRGLAYPMLVEGVMQTVSESIGAFLYPRTVTWMNQILKD